MPTADQLEAQAKQWFAWATAWTSLGNMDQAYFCLSQAYACLQAARYLRNNPTPPVMVQPIRP